MSDTIKFKSWECTVKLGKYSNGCTAISLVSAVQNEDIFLGEPIATATVNTPEIPISDNQIVVKNSLENEGMLQALQAAGLVEKEVFTKKFNYIEVVIATKTQKLVEMENFEFNQDKPAVKKNKMH